MEGVRTGDAGSPDVQRPLGIGSRNGGLSGSDDLLGDLVAKARQGARGETGAHGRLEKGERMRLMKRNKKTTAILTITLLTVAGGAFAYWSTTGSGTGNATNASSNGTVVLYAAFGNGLTPGASTTVTYTASNANTSSLRVGTITPTVSVDSTHVTAGCLAADFTIAPTASNTTVPANTIPASPVAAGSGTLSFADTALNQDGCKGAVITLGLTSN